MGGAVRFGGVLSSILLSISMGVTAAGAQSPCLNEDGYQRHPLWRGGGLYAGAINLLYEGTSFETGEPAVSALDGAVYNQRQHLENLIAESYMADAFLDLAIDSSTSIHGNRSLRIDFDGPYPSGEPSAQCELSWEWFEIDARDRYDITFYAKTSRNTHINVNLIGLDTLSHTVVWVDIDTSDTATHKRVSLTAGDWQRVEVRTDDSLSTSLRYILRLWTGGPGTPWWCVPEGTTIWLDALQVARAPAGGGAAEPYEYHTGAEELFLTVKNPAEPLPKWNHIFLAPDETGSIQGRAQVYQDTAYSARGGGTLHWKLYALFPSSSDPYTPVGEGSEAVLFLAPLQTVTVDLSPWVAGRLGLFKWIVEFEDQAELRADRQEITFAHVREVPVPSGETRNFAVNLNALGPSDKNDAGTYSQTATGGVSLRNALRLVSDLGFAEDRIFAAFNWGTVWEDPGDPKRYDFYPALANRCGITVFPVISSTPSWWSGYDWAAWGDFIDDAVGRYGPGGLYGDGITRWNLFNERTTPGSWTPSYYANFLFGAADTIHGTDPEGEMLISIHGWQIPEYLVELFQVSQSGTPVVDILDGVGVNRYARFDGGAEEIEPPEDPSTWHSQIPQATWIHRAARHAVQLVDTTGTGRVRLFPVTETGVTLGSLAADRRSLIGYYDDGSVKIFANSMSGSLAKAEQSAKRFIRHEILCLAEGGGPIYIFQFLPHPMSWSGALWGMFHADHSPAAALAAQVTLNEELGGAFFVRQVPAFDLYQPGHTPNHDFTARVFLFRDSEEAHFVIALWTLAPETEIEFNIDPSTYSVTARDIQGNDVPVTGSGSFVWTLTPEPSYIRVDKTIGVEGIVQAIDRVAPWMPTWQGWWEEEDRYFVRFDFNDKGDVDSLRLEYRASGDTAWTVGRTMDVWLHPDSGYTASFPRLPGTTYQARVAAPETYTGDVTYSHTLYLGPTEVIGAAETEGFSWRDSLSAGGPNPTRSSFFLSGTLARAGNLTLRVYDIAGREVRRAGLPASGPGPFRAEWDGRSDHGRLLSSGVYFLELEQEGRTIGRRRVVLMR